MCVRETKKKKFYIKKYFIRQEEGMCVFMFLNCLKEKREYQSSFHTNVVVYLLKERHTFLSLFSHYEVL